MAGFSGLELGLRALKANQKAIDVTGHNIANANTEGFSRQRVDLSATEPFTAPAFNSFTGAGQMGTGVTVSQVTRLRDGFADLMYRNNVKSQGFWTAKGEVLSKLEGVVSETSGAGLSNVLNDFFNAWQEMSKDPSTNNRAILVEKTNGMTAFMQNLSGELYQLAFDCDQVITGKVTDINSLAAQIVELNKDIAAVEKGRVVQNSSGSSVVRENNANDLRDQRDLLMDKLAKYGALSVTEDAVTGMVSAKLGDLQLVSGNSLTQLTTGNDPDGHIILNSNSGTGALTGYITGRDDSLKAMSTKLNQLAEELIYQVNTMHRQGVDATGQMGQDFFTGTGAADIAISAAIVADPKLIAAAKPPAGYPLTLPASGDGSNALVIYNLQSKLTARVGGMVDPANPDYNLNLGVFWRNSVFTLGLQGKEAIDQTRNQDLLVSQMEMKRQEVAGVSLDEEMTNMMKFQHGYNAAARIITIIDEMLDTVVNRLGTAGR